MCFVQITSHKWAWPFMKPVDVEGLELHDYHEVISLSHLFYHIFSILVMEIFDLLHHISKPLILLCKRLVIILDCIPI